MKTRITITLLMLGAASTAFGQDGNTTVGTNAGASITFGDNNTLVGENAGQSLTSGSRNVLIGKDAGKLLNNDFNNVYIGWLAASESISGIRNVFVGPETGPFNSGTDNVFIGSQAGQNNTSGLDNTFVGEEAGKFNTTGSDNTFIGEDAGFNTTTGIDNTAVGSAALRSCTTGFGNAVVGNEAGYDISMGVRNTCMGDFSGHDIGEGHFNTMIGSRAGRNTEHADYNTCVGMHAGWENNRSATTTGANRNTYLGVAAGSANRDGSDNVALGAFADFGPWNSTEQQLFDGFSADANAAPAGAPGNANTSRTVMVGSAAVASRDDAIGIGYGAWSRGTRAITIGATANSTHEDAVTIGYGAVSHAADTVVIGNDTTVGWHPNIDAVTELGNPAYRFTGVTAQRYDAIAAASTSADIELWADDGAADDDKWRISAADGGDLTIASFATGSYVPAITAANNGDVTIAGEISINSDARLKDNVRSIEEGLELVARLDGKTYGWKPGQGRDSRRHYGLIAQEVEAVLPELVTESAVGIKSVNYQGLVPVLVNAVNDLSRTIDRKDTEIANLRAEKNAEIADLAKRLVRLEALVAE